MTTNMTEQEYLHQAREITTYISEAGWLPYPLSQHPLANLPGAFQLAAKQLADELDLVVYGTTFNVGDFGV